MKNKLFKIKKLASFFLVFAFALPLSAQKTETMKSSSNVFQPSSSPLVSLRIQFLTGSTADPAGKEGTAHLTVVNIDMGTKTKNTLEIDDSLGNLGTSLQGFAGRESSTVSLEVLKRNLAPAMSIFADVILNPVFPVAEVEREKKRHLDNLAQEANDPNALAARVQNMLVFGPDHPYGRPRSGLPGTVKPITRDDLARFHETYWKPGGSALIFAGDITLAEATELARQSFLAWTGGAPPAVTIPDPRPLGAGKIFLIDKQDAAQTVVAQLLAAPQRKTDDYYQLNLADAVWGGGFQTRLNLNLRENKGYSYGAFSFPSLYSKSGIWVASGGVQTNKTKESIVEFVNELRFLGGGKPITETELADAKANRVRGYAQNFESLGQLVGQIATLWSQGLPMSELQREPDELQRATLAAVNAAAQKYAVLGKATLLLVGDLSKIRSGVEELKLGDIIVLDTEGRPVTKQ